jgi:hypothetical protein
LRVPAAPISPPDDDERAGDADADAEGLEQGVARCNGDRRRDRRDQSRYASDRVVDGGTDSGRALVDAGEDRGGQRPTVSDRPSENRKISGAPASDSRPDPKLRAMPRAHAPARVLVAPVSACQRYRVLPWDSIRMGPKLLLARLTVPDDAPRPPRPPCEGGGAFLRMVAPSAGLPFRDESRQRGSRIVKRGGGRGAGRRVSPTHA